MKEDMLRQMYMRYVSNMKKARKDYVDVPADRISKKKGKKR